MDRQGNTYTFLYASVLVIVVAAVLAFLSQALRPIQEKNAELSKKANILQSVNIESTAKDAAEKYQKHIGNNAFVVNIKGERVDTVAFDIDLAKEVKKAPADRLYPVFECTMDDGSIKYILPVRGKGLWGPIWGYISLDSDKNTIYGATFSAPKETPGLGAEIAKAPFQKEFANKTIFNKEGKFVSIQVVKAGKPTDIHAVDGISGGTITSRGVQNMLEDCLSGYKAFLKN